MSQLRSNDQEKSEKNSRIKKIYMIAGEASGDALGCAIIKDIKDKFKDTGITPEFCGIGGDMMQESGSFKSLFDMKELSVIGVFEVLKKIRHFFKLIKRTVADIKEIKPDMVITIDVPDFSFRVAKSLRKDGRLNKIKLVHTVAPTVWAWREGRAKKIAKIYDHLFALFDFEPPYFEKYNLPTTFIGHPALDLVEKDLHDNEKIEAFAKLYPELRDEDYVTVLPGSRVSEVDNLLPIYIKAITVWELENNVHQGVKFAMVVAPTVKNRVLEILKEHNIGDRFIIVDPAYKYICFKKSQAALAAAGTISLELGFCKTPTVVTYILNPLSYFLAKLLIKVKYASLPNIILGREVFKELFQENCNPEKIAAGLSDVIENSEEIRSCLDQLDQRFKSHSSAGEAIKNIFGI